MKPHALWITFSGEHLFPGSCKDRSGRKGPKPPPGFQEMKGLDRPAVWQSFKMVYDGFVGERPVLRGW